ncbi:MAG: DUF58 domain-containing protein [Myxococcales bacterium]
MALFRKQPAAVIASQGELLFDEAFQRKLEGLALVSRRLASGRDKAERKANRSASGVEFADHRPYVAGDDFRFLDWKVFARSDRLLLKQFEEQADLTVHVLLDCSSSMTQAGPAGSVSPKFAQAKRIAAALGYVALANLDRVSIQGFADGLTARLPPLRGKSRALRMLRFLESQDAAGRTDFARAAKSFAARESSRGLCLVITDGYDFQGLTHGLDALRYARLEPVLLLMLDPAELNPPLHGEWVLVDSETSEERSVTITGGLLERYREAHRQHFDTLRAHCRDKRVRCFELSVQTEFDQAVLLLLKQGGLLG